MPDTFAVLGVDPAMSRPCGVAVVLFRAGQPSIKFTRRMTAEGRDAIERVSWIGQQVADLCARLGLWGIPIGVGYEASWVGENVQTARKLGLVGGGVVTKRYAASVMYGDSVFAMRHEVVIVEARNKTHAGNKALDTVKAEKKRPEGWKFYSVKVAIIAAAVVEESDDDRNH